MRKNNKAKKHSPRFVALAAQVDKDTFYTLDDAIKLVKETAKAKFVESVDLAINLGVDPRKNDQNVRGITTIPHGTGKIKKVAVLAKGEQAQEAERAGADAVGADELISKIQGGFRDFDVLIAAEDMAPQIGKIGKLLGTKTPNKRNGTVTNSIESTVKEIKAATRIEYRTDKAGVMHLIIGKVNFTDDQLKENFLAAFGAVVRAKPSTAKGRYVESLTLSSSMGPGIPLDTTLAVKLVG